MNARSTLPARALFVAARPGQWQKNLLLLAAAIFSVDQHWDIADLDDWRRVAVRSIAGVALFCLASSAVYLANDVRDAKADRVHPRKRRRPVAAGDLTETAALSFAAVLAAAALAGGVALGFSFAVLVAAYLILSAAYTMVLRAIPVVEGLAVAAGFGLRAWAGAAAIDVPASPWLIALSTLGALYVVWLKREQEQAALGAEVGAHRPSLRSLSPRFLRGATGVTGWWIGGVFAAYAARPGSPGGGWLLLALAPVALGLWRFAVVARRPEARAVDEIVARDPPLLASVAAFVAVSFLALVIGR